MGRVVASLAAVVLALGLAACDDDGAEPGASREATLVLDFQPNAVHAGIYAALEEGLFEEHGVDLEIRVPGASTDAPKLLQAGRAEFAVMDINDVGIAQERGAEFELVYPIVSRPLASVIATDPSVRRPRDLEGRTVGVTGLPSDDAVLDSVVEADGGSPAAVDRVTIGFDSVAALSAGRASAATAFWNAEGVQLRDLGVDTREFRVDEFGAPRYPELLLVTGAETSFSLIQAVREALDDAYRDLADNPERALDSLLTSVDGLDREAQAAQLDALIGARAFTGTYRLLTDPAPIVAWGRWARAHGIVDRPPELKTRVQVD